MPPITKFNKIMRTKKARIWDKVWLPREVKLKAQKTAKKRGESLPQYLESLINQYARETNI
jgi:hypothetical protein